MQWNDICFCILLMDVFGTFGWLLFGLLKKWLDRTNARVRLVFIKVIICLYIIPVIYPVMLLSRIRYSEGSWIHIGEFGLHIPEKLELFFRIIAAFWVSGLLIGAAVSLYHYSRLDRTLRWNVPLTTEGWKKSVEKYLKKYGLTGVEVYQNESVETTLVTGLFRPMIIVPFRDYSEKRMSMMMEHEVWHVRRRDLLWKKLVLVASWVHWFNPLVYRLREYLTLQQEIVCDAAVCDINPEYTPKEYCQFLYDAEVKDVDRMFAVTLIETGLSLEHRIKEMLKRRQLVLMSGRWLFLCVLVFMVTAAVPSFAMARGVVKVDEVLRESSEVLIREEPQEPEPFLRGVDVGSVEEVVGEFSDEGLINVEVTVPAGVRYLFPERSLAAGDTVSITGVCDDSGLVFCVGIKNIETGELIYMEGSEVLVLSFTAEAAGAYCGYFENCSEVNGKMEGVVFYP